MLNSTMQLGSRKVRCLGRLAVIAVTAVVAATALSGTAPASAAAKPLRVPTRDPDLPHRPTKIADLFIADSYKNKENGEVEVDWFCKPGGENGPQKICQGDSKDAFNRLTAELNGAPERRPELLRVGKARDDCVNTAVESHCGTGVPPVPGNGCPAEGSEPSCVLTALKKRGIKLGVIVGSRDVPTDEGRSIQDLAWQACQIHKADQGMYKDDKGMDTKGFYDFLFLDQASLLNNDLKKAVKYINEGMIFKRHKSGKGGTWVREKDCGQGWDVLVNENHVKLNELAPQAWGHARHYDVAGKRASLRRAANGEREPLTNKDIEFIKAVESLNPPGGLTTGAVLRVEVTNGTGLLALLDPQQQCTILGLWAKKQMKANAPFASLFPLYNHGYNFYKDGVLQRSTLPYNSFFHETPTATRQLELIAYPGRGDEGPGCSPKGDQ